MNKTRKIPTYLTKFPISIRKKRHSRINQYTKKETHYKDEQCLDFRTRYGYFAVDRSNNINFIITLVDATNKVNYTIKIAKQHLYDSLMLFLMYRPIERKTKRNKEFRIHTNIESLVPESEMNELTPLEIKERYIDIKKRLGDFIKESPLQRRAELQMERLIEKQWKMELLYEIYESEKLINEEKRKKKMPPGK